MSLTLDIRHYNETKERKLICGWQAQRREAALQAISDKGVTLETDALISLKRSAPHVNPSSLYANAYVEAWNDSAVNSLSYAELLTHYRELGAGL